MVKREEEIVQLLYPLLDGGLNARTAWDVPPLYREKELTTREWKDKIGTVTNRKLWDNAVKHTNDYELVPALCKPRKLNRAYFKLCELIHDYQLMTKPPSTAGGANHNVWNDDYGCLFSSVHIAEGPGAFIECVADICSDLSIEHKWSAITLAQPATDVQVAGCRAEVPDFHSKYLTRQQRESICYGEDGTGDITVLENCKFFANFVKKRHPHGVKLVTADGGFDVSNDYNSQENASYKLFVYEVLCAFMVLSKGGNFVLKVFDLYDDRTQRLLNVLSGCFISVDISKPKMSRPCNSEKYVVCTCFLGTQSTHQGLGGTKIDFAHIIETMSELQIEAIKKTLNVATTKLSKHSVMERKAYQETIAREYLETYVE